MKSITFQGAAKSRAEIACSDFLSIPQPLRAIRTAGLARCLKTIGLFSSAVTIFTAVGNDPAAVFRGREFESFRKGAAMALPEKAAIAFPQKRTMDIWKKTKYNEPKKSFTDIDQAFLQSTPWPDKNTVCQDSGAVFRPRFFFYEKIR